VPEGLIPHILFSTSSLFAFAEITNIFHIFFSKHLRTYIRKHPFSHSFAFSCKLQDFFFEMDVYAEKAFCQSTLSWISFLFLQILLCKRERKFMDLFLLLAIWLPSKKYFYKCCVLTRQLCSVSRRKVTEKRSANKFIGSELYFFLPLKCFIMILLSLHILTLSYCLYCFAINFSSSLSFFFHTLENHLRNFSFSYPSSSLRFNP
jgi:hypothetical protein